MSIMLKIWFLFSWLFWYSSKLVLADPCNPPDGIYTSQDNDACCLSDGTPTTLG